MKGHTLGIRTQLTAGIVLTTLAGIGVMGLLTLKVLSSNALFWKAREAENTARFLRAVSRGPDGPGLVERAMKEAGVSEYRIIVPGGGLVESKGEVREGPGKVIPVSDEITVKSMGGGWLAPGRELFVSSGLPSGGRVEFTVPLGDVAEELAGVRRLILYYAAADSVVIIIFGLYLVSRSVTAPLKRLERTATRIASGDLGERAELGVDNELGSLAGSFNTMAEKLEEEIKALERVNRELVATQEELLRSKTLAAVGRLGAGLAHEIGNPLGAVLGYLDILKKDSSGRLGEADAEIVQRISAEITRIDTTVRGFLEVSRPREKAAPVEVNSLVEETIRGVEARGELEGVSVEAELAEELPPVMIEEGKLRQVLMNLLINAAHAVRDNPGEKAVTVATSTEDRESVRRRREDRPMYQAGLKRYVTVRFEDNGRGITGEEAEKVFDPFFTTKEVGEGTGLGLYVSQGLVRAYGGDIDFSSGPGMGSVFKVSLPAEHS